MNSLEDAINALVVPVLDPPAVIPALVVASIALFSAIYLRHFLSNSTDLIASASNPLF